MRTGICLAFAGSLMGATLFVGGAWAQQAPMAGAQMQHGHTMGQATTTDPSGAIQNENYGFPVRKMAISVSVRSPASPIPLTPAAVSSMSYSTRRISATPSSITA